jgi:outer membrane receptor protein involved in Fe transport
MRKTGLLGTSAIRSAIFAGIAMTALTPALAQEVPEDAETPGQSEAEIESGTAVSDDSTDQTITVTGSRIRRPNLESTVPITSIGGEEFFQTGQVAVGDVLNELPALRSTFSQSNAGQFLGTTGLNLLDLRGLGTQRTLTLVNGRRHVAADVLNNGVSVDVNTIPADLIERVDIVTGGNSAIYGSDAIAGVVNFILKRDYDGAQFRAQSGVSKYGDAASYTIAGMIGRNFADGRGNAVLHAEYAHQDIYFADDRPSTAQNDAFVQVDSDPGGTPNGSDGIPDRVFVRDIRGATISSNGLFSIAQRISNPLCGLGFNGTATTGAYNCNYLFNPAGTILEQQTGGRIGSGPNGVFSGGNGPTNRDDGLVTLLPEYDRYSVNFLGHFTVSDAFEPFVEAKYTKTRSYGRSSGPVFVQGSTLGDPGQRERIRLDNPFLTPDARAVLTNAILAGGVNPDSTVTSRNPLTAAQLAAIQNGSFRVGFRKNFTDLGNRNEEINRETFRIVSGARGTFNDDWQYEFSVNYGQFKEENDIEGDVNLQRFLLALDAGIDPANGQIRCRAQFDPAARIDYAGAGEASLNADIAACVPLNAFGRNPSAAARDYVVANTHASAKMTQFVVNAFVSGDSSQLFELPGGPIGFALGAEYRREKTTYIADPLAAAGNTFYNAIPDFGPEKFDVKEAFGEIRLPILKDMPFFNELTVSAAGRVADYPGGTGTVFAYNAGVDWAPIRDLRFRANYSRAVRAPNVSETAGELSQNFAPGFQDPCLARNIGAGSQFRAANCAADLGPLLAGLDLPAYSLEILSGSNPDLQEETSSSWTIGGVFQPSFVPGLSISVDYYDITVDDVIVSLSAQNIVNSCYDLPSLDNQFCALIERYRGSDEGPNGEVPGQILDSFIEVTPLNFASYKAKGIDTEIAYRRTIDGLGTLNTRFIYTHSLKRSNYTNPADPTFENRLLSELGTPQDEFIWNIDLKTGPVNLGYQMRYIGKQVVNLYEDFFSLQGRTPQDADYADRIWYPSVLYHDARIGLDVNDKFNFYLGVDNITNRMPPLGLTGVGDGSGIYNTRGRFFYGGVVAKF